MKGPHAFNETAYSPGPMPWGARFMPIRILAMFLVALAASPAQAQNLDLFNVTLVDGPGAAPRPGVAVSVRGGKIAAISDRAPGSTAGIRQVDLKGRYLLPGLI